MFRDVKEKVSQKVFLPNEMNDDHIFHLEHNADQLPDLTKSEDIFNVLALCMYCILSNVLDSRTYSFPDQSPQELDILLQQRMQYDYNALSPVDRRTFSYYRGLAVNLISWISCHYLGLDSEGDGDNMESIEDLALVYLKRLASGLLNYKVCLTRVQQLGRPNCTIADVRRQLDLLFENPILGLQKSFLSAADIGTAKEFGLGFSPDRYSFAENPDPLNFEGK